MARAKALLRSDCSQTLLEAYVVNERINQFLLEQLDSRAWRSKPSGHNGRSIAAIFTHMHNMRRKWLRLSAPHIKLPAELNRARCTQKQASAALANSGKQCAEMLAEALTPGGRIKQFVRDGWARPWPAGPAMVIYMISHDTHHRGQICMLAHQLGYPIKTGYEMWNWEKLWKQCGFSGPH
jgi:uncharacterized damage-inducible protein DinB